MTLLKPNSISSLMLKRIGLGLVTLWVISLLIFAGVEALPGDLAEAVLGQGATPETVASFRKELKLDLPPHVRYAAWLGPLSGAISETPWPTSGPWST
jgi:peptide/nickel transport system permease protein